VPTDQFSGKGLECTGTCQFLPSLHPGMALEFHELRQHAPQHGSVLGKFGVRAGQISGPHVKRGSEFDPVGLAHGPPKRGRQLQVAHSARFSLGDNGTPWIKSTELSRERTLKGFLGWLRLVHGTQQRSTVCSQRLQIQCLHATSRESAQNLRLCCTCIAVEQNQTVRQRRVTKHRNHKSTVGTVSADEGSGTPPDL